MKLSKTIYLNYRDCAHNAWVRMHKPDIYEGFPPSEFEQALIETGQDVDELARELFPGGILIERNDYASTVDHVGRRTPLLYQPVFETSQYTTACDIAQGIYDASIPLFLAAQQLGVPLTQFVGGAAIGNTLVTESWVPRPSGH